MFEEKRFCKTFARMNLSTQLVYRIAIQLLFMRMTTTNFNSKILFRFTSRFGRYGYYNQSNDVFKMGSSHCFLLLRRKNEANPQNSILDYTVNRNSRANTAINTNHCSSGKARSVRNRGRKWKLNEKEFAQSREASTA